MAAPYELGRVLSGHSDGVTCLAWSEDSTLLASGSDDGTLRLWNPKLGVCVRTITSHGGPLWCCAWSANLLASGGSYEVT